MAVYFITGTLGAGKSLIAVSKIRDYLMQGRPIATNIDLNLKWLVGSKAEFLTAYRIPDRPSARDLEVIGYGNKTKNEENNGALVLDECGVWFNTRNWNSKGRQEIINFLLMARKLGWDIYIIVQHINMVDVQARLIAQYVAHCLRIDRVRIPIISPVFKLLTGKPLPLPTIHYAVVRMGASPQAMKSDTWTYRGHDLYAAYNTRQVFHTEDDSQAVYSLIPPIYYHKEPTLEYTPRNIMRLTRIHLRRWNRVTLIGASAIIAATAMYIARPFIDQIDPTVITQQSKLDSYEAIAIRAYTRLPGVGEHYIFEIDGKHVTSRDLISSGIRVYSGGKCQAQLEDKITKQTRIVDCG